MPYYIILCLLFILLILGFCIKKYKTVISIFITLFNIWFIYAMILCFMSEKTFIIKKPINYEGAQTVILNKIPININERTNKFCDKNQSIKITFYKSTESLGIKFPNIYEIKIINDKGE